MNERVSQYDTDDVEESGLLKVDLLGKRQDFYYAQTDKNGVLCVDQLAKDEVEWNPEYVAVLATVYPEVIYFRIEAR